MSLYAASIAEEKAEGILNSNGADAEPLGSVIYIEMT
jgi:hypothetical protein